MLDFFKNLSATRILSVAAGAAILTGTLLTAGCSPAEEPSGSEDTSGAGSQSLTTGSAAENLTTDGTAGTTGGTDSLQTNPDTTGAGTDTTIGGSVTPDTTFTDGTGTHPTTGAPTTGRPTEGTKPYPDSAKVFYVADYGAKGDGKADDGVALAKCVKAACMDLAPHKVVRFAPNSTYRVKTLPDTHTYYRDIFQIVHAKNITIEGNGSTLLMKAPLRVGYFYQSSNITVKDFHIDFDPKPFALGTVRKKSSNSITFACNKYLGFTGSVNPPQPYFALRNRKDERMHYFIDKMTNNGDGTYTFYFSDRNRVSMAEVGEDFILPVYGSAHLYGGVFEVKDNENVTLENIVINDMPGFGFDIRRNRGKVLFKNVQIRPPEDSKIHLASWRDGFHVKDNLAQLVWDKCYIGPLGDDAFNLASVTCTIRSYDKKNRIVAAVPDEDIHTRDGLSVGDEVVIYDNINNKEIGYAKIAKVIPSGDSVTIQLDKDLPVERGQILGIYRFNKDFKVMNSYIEGTVRVRSSGTFERCKFNVFWVRVENDMGIEGPIPKDVFFRGCEFRTPYSGNPVVFHVGTNTKMGSMGNYKCKNIVLDHCNFIQCRASALPGNELEIRK